MDAGVPLALQTRAFGVSLLPLSGLAAVAPPSPFVTTDLGLAVPMVGVTLAVAVAVVVGVVIFEALLV